MRRAFVNVRGGSAVNQQAEQFRPAVMASGIHDLLSLIDQGEIEVGDDYAFPRANGLAEQTSVRRNDRGEATAGERADVATSVFSDLCQLIRIQPGGSADDEGSGLQSMLPDVDFGLLREQIAKDGTGIHGRVDLLAVGHHRVPRQRVVVLPTRQLSNPSDLAFHRARARAIALSPNHALVVGGRDLASPLKQGAVGIEEKLRVVQSSLIPFINADRDNDSPLPASVADCVGGKRGYRDRLFE